MRKFIAVLLAVLMLASVLAVLPASAATYDGTTATTEGLHELIITEIAQKSNEKDGDSYSYASSTGYVEVFNNSANTVDLSTLSLLRGVYYTGEPDEEDAYYEVHRTWAVDKKFVAKMDILAGNILPYDKAQAYVANNIFTDSDESDSLIDDYAYKFLTNDAADLSLESGKTAVIWFITDQTLAWLRVKSNNGLVTNFDPRAAFLQRYYGNQVNVDDYQVIMVWAYKNVDFDDKLAKDMFTWEVPKYNDDKQNFVIALAENTWNLTADRAYTDGVGRNAKVKSMALIGNAVADYAQAVDNNSSYFAPATTKPAYLNAKNEYAAVAGLQPETYNNYVDAGLAESFAEVASIIWAATPTPGAIDNWQWAMMESALADGIAMPDAVGDATKQAAAIDAFLKSQGIGDDTITDGRVEPDIQHNFVDRQELMDRFFNNQEDEEEGGLPTWALILIIVGGVVVVLGAAAVIVFVVILPKKRKAAAAAAADEDAPAEDAAEEAPAEEAAEEAPAEDTPAEE